MHGHDYIREYLIYCYIIDVLDERSWTYVAVFDDVVNAMIANWDLCRRSPYRDLVSYSDAREGHNFLTSRDYPLDIRKEATDKLNEYYATRAGWWQDGMCGC